MYQGLMNRVQILKAKNCNVPEIGGLGFPFAKIRDSHGDSDNSDMASQRIVLLLQVRGSGLPDQFSAMK